MMRMLAFEPMTGAIGMYFVEHTCRSRGWRIVPRTHVMLRRVQEVLVDTAVNEAAEPLMDQVVNVMDMHVMGLIVVMLVLWRYHYSIVYFLCYSLLLGICEEGEG